jgi:hypothetical protein
MITTIVVADATVDVVSSMLSRAAIVATPELLLERRVLLCQRTVAPPQAFSQAPGVALVGAVIAPQVVAWLHRLRAWH